MLLGAEAFIPDVSALFSHFGAEVVLALGIPLLLVADLFTRRNKESVTGALSLVLLTVAFVLGLWQDSSSSVGLTSLLRADGLAKGFRVIALASGVITAVAALRGGDAVRHRTEFFVLLMGAVLGACLTAAANEMAMLYLAIETLSIAGYLLAGFKRRDPQGSEAALKYIIFGAISSGMMLYGLTLLYGFGGTSLLTTPPGAPEGTVSLQSYLQENASALAMKPAFIAAVVLVFAGLAYKIAAAPFHFWCPDVYQGAPTSVAGFLAVAGKGAGLAAFIRVVQAVTGGAGDHITDLLARHNDVIRTVLIGMSIATMTIGNVAALRQRNAKRILAYSAIAHAGYILMGLTVTSRAGATAMLFYMGVYVFMTFGAFFMVALVEREKGSCDLSAFEGLGFRAPFFAVSFAIVLISLTGLPPTGGFWAKVFLFEGVFSYGGAHSSSLYLWFGVIGLLNGVISLVYYARFLKAMYLADPEQNTGSGLELGLADKSMVFAMTLPQLVLGVMFAGLYETAQLLVVDLF